MLKATVKNLISSIILVGILLAFYKYINIQEVLVALENFKLEYLPIMLGLSLVFFILKGLRFAILTRPVTSIAISKLAKLYFAGEPATLLPGGIAIRAALMSQIQIPIGKTLLPVSLSSILDHVFFISGAMVAAIFFKEVRNYMLLTLIGLSLITLAIYFFRNILNKTISETLKRFNKQTIWENFLESIAQVLTPAVILKSLVLTFTANLLGYIMLLLALRGVGIITAPHSVFMASVLPVMLGRMLPVPGGLGITETGIIGFLVEVSSVDPELAAAGTIIYRTTHVFFQALVGTLVYFFAWKGTKEANDQTSS